MGFLLWSEVHSGAAYLRWVTFVNRAEHQDFTNRASAEAPQPEATVAEALTLEIGFFVLPRGAPPAKFRRVGVNDITNHAIAHPKLTSYGCV